MTTTETPALLVSDLRRLGLVTVPAHASLQEAARAMLRGRSPGVLLEDSDAILTEHDLVRAIARGDSPHAAACAFATPSARSVDVHATVLEAVETMLTHGHRLLVVVDRDAVPCGFLTLLEAVAAVIDRPDVPSWLAGLRFALHVESSDI